MTNNPPCIISAGIGNWYSRGVTRLERSLIMHGYAGDMIMWKDEYPPNSEQHKDNPYNFKIWAFEDAISKGYKTIMWLDASFWCIKTPHDLFDTIIDNGIFGFRTGYNCAQTCSDKLLDWADITRDKAETIPEIATGIVGLHLDNPTALTVYTIWATMMNASLFKNDRLHNINDSADPRFLHGRQDQSAFSIACHLAGVNIPQTEAVAYYSPNYSPDNTYFLIGGL